ncbi:MAG TPA: hypothetical protein VFV99_24405 [Kofleriaceae bacterium]|nr:hypothetical protein [Kofleriaceae bacterium]
MRKLFVGFVLGIVFAACGGKKASNEPPPAQPATGAPIAFEAKSFKTNGKSRGGTVEVKAYNFSDKKLAQYWLLFRYTDATGNVLKVKQGTPFEKDTDFMTLSGNRFKCEPKSWCAFKIDNLEVPEKTAKVEVLARSVTALKDGMHFEDKPLWELNGTEWPGDASAPPAGSAAATPAEGSAAGSGHAAAPPPEGSAGSAGSGSAS